MPYSNDRGSVIDSQLTFMKVAMDVHPWLWVLTKLGQVRMFNHYLYFQGQRVRDIARENREDAKALSVDLNALHSLILNDRNIYNPMPL